MKKSMKYIMQIRWRVHSFLYKKQKVLSETGCSEILIVFETEMRRI